MGAPQKGVACLRPGEKSALCLTEASGRLPEAPDSRGEILPGSSVLEAGDSAKQRREVAAFPAQAKPTHETQKDLRLLILAVKAKAPRCSSATSGRRELPRRLPQPHRSTHVLTLGSYFSCQEARNAHHPWAVGFCFESALMS